MEKTKLILVGESGVGKTSIINQFLSKTFDSNITTSLTCDKWEKTIKLKDNKYLNVDIWDTAGQEKFRAINKIFLKNTQIALLVYDITDKNSFEQLKYWYDIINEINKNEKIIFGIVANKSDLYKKQKVFQEEGENFAQKYCRNSSFFESSALDYEKIENIFVEISEIYVNRNGKTNENNNENNNINFPDNQENNEKFSLNREKNIDKSKCCGKK
jgi:small GTP-binding protein